MPVFGICLGHQLLGRALGAETVKLPFGHHGANHPVKDLTTGAIEITSQNHNFAVDASDLPGGVELTHVNLNDGVCEGLAVRRGRRLQRPAPPRGRSRPPRQRATCSPASPTAWPPAGGRNPELFTPAVEFLAVSAKSSTRKRSPRGGAGSGLPAPAEGGGLMPRRDDLSSILVIGSGPIVIGQACEFDYSGTQACRVLREEGYRVVLVNSNPATIMTDPDFADRTYVEPLTPEVVARIIERERPDAVLPTLGGQTGLNVAMALYEQGLIGVPGTPEMIGANAEAIATAEDRERFKEAMVGIGLDVPRSGIAHTIDEARAVAGDIGLPVIIRPAYILGGRGTGIAHSVEQFERLAATGIAASPIGEILVEESIAGWKEFELEVMRDRADNCVIICSIENVDPMGVHTGDSITVAPAQTLTDVEYQAMRDAAFACIRRVGVETGGSNVQFALDPMTGRQVVIEMNPRVSRSSALASKATGFPIAKIAARLAVGYTLDEIPNDVTRATPASFEPVIDYVVTKVPRWAFEKLPGTTGVLGTQMQSVGEVMAIGRTFPESLQKALRSLEQGRLGLNCDPAEGELAAPDDDELLAAIAVPTPDRIFQIGELLRRGVTVERIHDACRIDIWFLDQMLAIVEERHVLAELGEPAALDARAWRRAKRLGFSDAQLGHLWEQPEDVVRAARQAARCRADVQDRRHVRRRVRRGDAVPLLDVGGRDRGPPVRPPAGDHPRLRPQPHRAGHRVRLLLRARQLRPARGRVRDGDGQLQPGDRVDGLRHLGSALLRAAHRRGRRARHRRRDRRRRRRAAEGHRLARRADAAQAGVADPCRS